MVSVERLEIESLRHDLKGVQAPRTERGSTPSLAPPYNRGSESILVSAGLDNKPAPKPSVGVSKQTSPR